MKRMIDADALIEDIRDGVGIISGLTRRWFIELIKLQPTVDAVPVIRCKDCKYCREYCRVVNGIRTEYACDILDEHYDPYGKKRVAFDDYCSRAERRGEE